MQVAQIISQSIADLKHSEAMLVINPEIGGIHNGKTDAWRHASWSKKSSETVGEGLTCLFGVWHEIENIFQDNRPFKQVLKEVIMDLTNNKKGRSAANTMIDLLEAAKKGELYTLEPNNSTDYKDLTNNNENDSNNTKGKNPSSATGSTGSWLTQNPGWHWGPTPQTLWNRAQDGNL